MAKQKAPKKPAAPKAPKTPKPAKVSKSGKKVNADEYTVFLTVTFLALAISLTLLILEYNRIKKEMGANPKANIVKPLSVEESGRIDIFGRNFS